jgi:hypothetical protein
VGFDPDPGPNVEGGPKYSGSQGSLQESGIECEVAEKRQLSITWIVGLVVMALHPPYNFLDTVLDQIARMLRNSVLADLLFDGHLL